MTFAQAVRDVLIASMRYAQFPFAMLGLLAGIIIWRMPPDDLSKLLFRLIEDFENGSLLGYALFGLAIIGWFYTVRRQRKLIASEMDRIGEQKSKLQEQLLGNKIQSSKKRPQQRKGGKDGKTAD